MLEEYIKKLQPYVISMFKLDSSGHDINHLIRTMNNALYIQEKEGGDRVIIGLAAFLHDIHRILEKEMGHFVSPKDSIPKIKEILSNINLDEEQVNEICFCIENHENYNWNSNNVNDINALILQDADNLDAIGAIGIARAFTAGGSYGASIYDPTKALNNNEAFIEGSKDYSVIHHFYRKLFKLGDNMNTKTAKDLATKRIDFMKNFTEEFLNEWNSKI